MEMETPSPSINLGMAVSTKPNYAPTEMPKLIPPTQIHRLNDFSFAGGDMNLSQPISCYLTNFVSIKNEQDQHPLIANGPVSVREDSQVPVSKYSSTNSVLTNGNIIQNQCDEINHKCLDCGEIHPESQIFAHVKSHLKKGQRECKHCTYKSIASGDLRDHMCKHYNLKPYKCPYCYKLYGWQSGWKKHIATHEHSSSRKTNELAATKSKQKQKRTAIVNKKIPKVEPQTVYQGHESNGEVHFHDSQVPHPRDSSYPNCPPNYEYAPQQSVYSPSAYNNDNHRAQAQAYYSVNASRCYNNTNSDFTQHLQPQVRHSPGEMQNSWETQQQNSCQPTQVSNSSQQVGINNWNEQQEQTANYAEQNHNQDPEAAKDENGTQEFREPEDIRETETCKTCGEEIQMRDLPAHIQSHILPGQKGCTICKYKSTTKVYLAEHYNIHYGLKPYSCNICKRKFAMRSYLRSHVQRVHDNESSRKYPCRYCNKRFVRSCHLRTHEMVHEGQREIGTVREASFGSPAIDSDSNSNSNTSFRTPVTPERRSSTSASSPSNPGNYSRSNTNSPQTTPMSSICGTPNSKGETHWNGTSDHPVDQGQSQPTAPWPQYFHPSVPYDQSWNPIYSPLVKSDVNWTDPLYDTSPWHQGQGQIPSSQGNVGYTTPQKAESFIAESPGYYPMNNSSTIPPSASVQDLWAELHFEEMKWFPETSSAYTADGIPMITELAPLDGFSYTEMLNNATADLPIFGNATCQIRDFQDSQEFGGNFQEVNIEVKINKKQNSERNKGTTGTKPGQSRGSGNKFNKSAKRPSVCDTDLVSSVAGSPKPSELSDDEEGGDDDPDSLDTCLTCHEEIARKDLLAHIRGHLVSGQRTCTICQRTYCNPMTLKEHITHVHYKLKHYKCAFCDKKYSTKYSRKTHEVFNHEQRKSSIVKCPYTDCGKPFAMRSELHKHIRAHAKKNGTSVPVHLLSTAKTNKQTNRKSSKVKKEAKDSVGTEDIQTEHNIKAERLIDATTKTWEVRVEDIGRKMNIRCNLCGEDVLLADFVKHKENHSAQNS